MTAPASRVDVRDQPLAVLKLPASLEGAIRKDLGISTVRELLDVGSWRLSFVPGVRHRSINRIEESLKRHAGVAELSEGPTLLPCVTEEDRQHVLTQSIFLLELRWLVTNRLHLAGFVFIRDVTRLTLSELAAVLGPSGSGGGRAGLGSGVRLAEEVSRCLRDLGLSLHAEGAASIEVSERDSVASTLVEALVQRWNADEAKVLGDWCSERGLAGAAAALRAGPSGLARGQIDALAAALGIRQPPQPVYWMRGGWYRPEGLTATAERSGSTDRSRPVGANRRAFADELG